MVLGALIGMPQQSTSTDSTSFMNSADSPSDAVDNLFNGMDSDGNGAVSQSELESYVTAKGGTANEADGLYTMLTNSGDSSSGISKDDLMSQMPPPPSGPPPGHMQSASGANGLAAHLDINSDGQISKDEFADFISANGGTSDEAQADFSALGSSQNGTVSTSDFAKLVDQNSQPDNPYNSILNFFDSLASNNAAGAKVSATV